MRSAIRVISVLGSSADAIDAVVRRPGTRGCPKPSAPKHQGNDCRYVSRYMAICCRLVQSGQMTAAVRFISGLVCPPTKMLLRVSHVPGIFSTFHANIRLPSAANLAATDTPPPWRQQDFLSPDPRKDIPTRTKYLVCGPRWGGWLYRVPATNGQGQFWCWWATRDVRLCAGPIAGSIRHERHCWPLFRGILGHPHCYSLGIDSRLTGAVPPPRSPEHPKARRQLSDPCPCSRSVHVYGLGHGVEARGALFLSRARQLQDAA